MGAQRCVKGEQLCRQGARGHEFFVLVNGTVALHRKEAKETFGAGEGSRMRREQRRSSIQGVVTRSR